MLPAKDMHAEMPDINPMLNPGVRAQSPSLPFLSSLKGRPHMKILRTHWLASIYLLVASSIHLLAAPTVLTFGETATGTISAAAQINQYTFTANANDIIDIAAVRTSGGLSPKIQLFTSSGTVIPLPNAPNCLSTTIEEFPVKLPASNNNSYSIWFSDCSSTYTGNYDMYLQRLNNPVGAVTMSYGQTASGTITYGVQNNTYTFSATKGDLIDFTVARSGNFAPRLRLFSAGALIGSAVNSGCLSPEVEWNGVSIPATGTYILLVGDCSNTYTGGYSIYSQRTNNPSGASALLWGQSQSGAINSAAQSNTYTFSGTSGDNIDLTVTRSGNLSPKIRIYGPLEVGLVTSANVPSGGCLNTVSTISNFQLAETGTYTVLIGDCTDVYTGTYSMTGECKGVCSLAAPVLTTMSPSSAPAGSPAITVTLTGANFVNVDANSYAEWVANSTELSTQWISTTELKAVIPSNDLKSPGVYPVKVCTPAPGLGCSGELNFTVLGPVISSLSPSSATAGGPAFTLTVNGVNLVSGSVVKWNGTALTTTWISNTQLTAAVPAADIVTAGTYPITVTNSLGTSPAVSYTVNDPLPVLTSISPSTIIAGGTGFTLTATGSGFVHASKIYWNGAALTTTYVSATELQAPIPATDILDGDISVTVFNPTPAGGTSAAKTLAIDNPVPVLMTVAPTSATHGGAAFTLTANGFDFNEGAKILWNGVALTTTFVSDMQLTATVPATDIAAAGTATVTVTNPAPTPSASNGVAFTIK